MAVAKLPCYCPFHANIQFRFPLSLYMTALGILAGEGVGASFEEPHLQLMSYIVEPVILRILRTYSAYCTGC